MADDPAGVVAAGTTAPVVVLGIPRSGTTWVAGVIAASTGARLVHEPDNEKEQLAAAAVKSSLGRFPVLGPDDAAPGYEALWRAALHGSDVSTRRPRDRAADRIWRRASQDSRERAVSADPDLRVRLAQALCSTPSAVAPRHAGAPGIGHVVKSVHAALAAQFLIEVLSPPKVVVVIRHPANVLSSLLELQLPDRDRLLDRDAQVLRRFVTRWGAPLPAGSPAARAAWQVCLLTSALLETAQRYPQLVVIEHENACDAPDREFRRVCDELDLPWTAAGEDFLRRSDQPGTGFQTKRRAHEQPDRWTTRLAAADVEALSAVMRSFPHLDRWSRDMTRAGQR